jgi:hypothetical protein
VSAGVAERPRLFQGSPLEIGRTGATPDRNSSDGGRLTLEQKLASVWEGLHAGGAAECPVCHGRMHRARGTTVARCEGCRATLG